MIATTFQLKSETFEGPLDLLLSLIEKNKLHVSEVSLAAVTDEYLKHLETLEHSRHHDIADFVVLAATLLLLKSISLLPNLEITEEEGASIEELELRLEHYARIRGLGEHLRKLYRKSPSYLMQKGVRPGVVFSPTPSLTPQALFEAMNSTIAAIPLPTPRPRVSMRKVITLEEAIHRLAVRVQENIKTNFRSLIARKATKTDIVVSFLALLELVKRGALRAEQQEAFGDIELESHEIVTPRYGDWD